MTKDSLDEVFEKEISFLLYVSMEQLTIIMFKVIDCLIVWSHIDCLERCIIIMIHTFAFYVTLLYTDYWFYNNLLLIIYIVTYNSTQTTQTCWSLRVAKLKLRYFNRHLQPKLPVSSATDFLNCISIQKLLNHCKI